MHVKHARHGSILCLPLVEQGQLDICPEAISARRARSLVKDGRVTLKPYPIE
jgi:hypothetical protein